MAFTFATAGAELIAWFQAIRRLSPTRISASIDQLIEKISDLKIKISDLKINAARLKPLVRELWTSHTSNFKDTWRRLHAQ
jgi:hypothetical protein